MYALILRYSSTKQIHMVTNTVYNIFVARTIDIQFFSKILRKEAKFLLTNSPNHKKHVNSKNDINIHTSMYVRRSLPVTVVNMPSYRDLLAFLIHLLGEGFVSLAWWTLQVTRNSWLYFYLLFFHSWRSHLPQWRIVEFVVSFLLFIYSCSLYFLLCLYMFTLLWRGQISEAVIIETLTVEQQRQRLITLSLFDYLLVFPPSIVTVNTQTVWFFCTLITTDLNCVMYVMRVWSYLNTITVNFCKGCC